MLRIDKEKIKNMKPEDVSMDELLAVHETRKSGLYNMFSPQARAMAGIDDINKWIYIMENLKDIEYHYIDELASSKLKDDELVSSKLKNKIIKAAKTKGIYKLYYKSSFINKDEVDYTTIHDITYNGDKVTFKSVGLSEKWSVSIDSITDIVYHRDEIGY